MLFLRRWGCSDKMKEPGKEFARKFVPGIENMLSEGRFD